MAYDADFAERLRKRLSSLSPLEEKKMMGGLCFMYNDKMLVGIIKNELLVRVDPAIHEALLKQPGVHPMVFTTKPMSGFVQVEQAAIQTNTELDHFIRLAVDYNPKAKASKKKK